MKLKHFNAFGLGMAILYLILAIFLGPRFGYEAIHRDDAIRRMEAAPTKQEAISFALPAMQQMYLVIRAAKAALFISCGIVLVNGAIFLCNLRRKETRSDVGKA